MKVDMVNMAEIYVSVEVYTQLEVLNVQKLLIKDIRVQIYKKTSLLFAEMLNLFHIFVKS